MKPKTCQSCRYKRWASGHYSCGHPRWILHDPPREIAISDVGIEPLVEFHEACDNWEEYTAP